MWPIEIWPPMRFKDGIKVGAKGGHGPIRYAVIKYDPNEIIEFRFSRPKGFDGIHKLELKEISNQETEITHTISLHTSGSGTLAWIFAIRSLHNALIEDAFDKLENSFSGGTKRTAWDIWVQVLRKFLS